MTKEDDGRIENLISRTWLTRFFPYETKSGLSIKKEKKQHVLNIENFRYISSIKLDII